MFARTRAVNTFERMPPRHGEVAPCFSLSHRATRLVWNVTWLVLASWTPPSLWFWRAALLRLFGARIGERSDVRGSARVWHPKNLQMGNRSIVAAGVNCYNMGPLVIGDFCTVSQRAFLCGGTHDVDSPAFQLVTREIVIGDYCWIGAEAMIGPGAHIGEGAVVGARAAAFGRLQPWTIYIGNPALPKRAREKWV